MPYADPIQKAAYQKRYVRVWRRVRYRRFKKAGVCPRCGFGHRGKFAFCFKCRCEISNMHHRRAKRRPKVLCAGPCGKLFRPSRGNKSGRCRHCTCSAAGKARAVKLSPERRRQIGLLGGAASTKQREAKRHEARPL